MPEKLTAKDIGKSRGHQHMSKFDSVVVSQDGRIREKNIVDFLSDIDSGFGGIPNILVRLDDGFGGGGGGGGGGAGELLDELNNIHLPRLQRRLATLNDEKLPQLDDELGTLETQLNELDTSKIESLEANQATLDDELNDLDGRLNDKLNDAPDEIAKTHVSDNAIETPQLATNQIVANDAFIEDLVTTNLFANKIVTNNLFVEELVTRQLFADELVAYDVFTNNLTAKNAFVEKIVANQAFVNELVTNNVWANTVTANNAFANYIVSNEIWTDQIVANDAFVDDLHVVGGLTISGWSITDTAIENIDDQGVGVRLSSAKPSLEVIDSNKGYVVMNPNLSTPPDPDLLGSGATDPASSGHTTYSVQDQGSFAVVEWGYRNEGSETQEYGADATIETTIQGYDGSEWVDIHTVDNRVSGEGSGATIRYRTVVISTAGIQQVRVDFTVLSLERNANITEADGTTREYHSTTLINSRGIFVKVSPNITKKLGAVPTGKGTAFAPGNYVPASGGRYTGEVRFGNSTYTDPDSGVAYDAKYGGSGNGIAVSGDSKFTDDVYMGGNLLATQNYVDNNTSSYSHWRLRAAGGALTNIGSEEAVTFAESGPISVSRSGNQITIDSSALTSIPSSYVQESDNITRLNNNAGYVTSSDTYSGFYLEANSGGPTLVGDQETVRIMESGPIVVTRSGNDIQINSTALTSIPSSYVQESDNITRLNNNAGYVTSSALYDGFYLEANSDGGTFIGNQETVRIVESGPIAVTRSGNDVYIGSTALESVPASYVEEGDSPSFSSLTVNNDITAGGIVEGADWSLGSDRRLKDDIKLIDDPLSRVANIDPWDFERKDMEGRFVGVMADQVEAAHPEATYERGGYQRVLGMAVPALNAGAIGQLLGRIEELEQEVRALREET